MANNKWHDMHVCLRLVNVWRVSDALFAFVVASQVSIQTIIRSRKEKRGSSSTRGFENSSLERVPFCGVLTLNIFHIFKMIDINSGFVF